VNSSFITPDSLREATRKLVGTAGHMVKVWLVLKHMGLQQGASQIAIDTANSTHSLKELFGCGAPDGRFYVPFAHTSRYMTMKHDASRSIIQTTIQRWATSGSVVTCDPTSFLDIQNSPDHGLTVKTARCYPLGLGHGESGFALEKDARVQIPITAFAAWYSRQASIPSSVDPREFIITRLLSDLHVATAERELIFVDDSMKVAVGPSMIGDEDLFEICQGIVNSKDVPAALVQQESYDQYATRVASMASSLDSPAWLRSDPGEEVRGLIDRGHKAILLYGPPRTGKTRIVDSICPRANPQRSTIQIHDGWSYDNLIQGLVPAEDGTWGWRDGPLKNSIESGKKYIVLEEVNRTNISQALGEVFSLIEESYRGQSNSITLRNGQSFFVPDDVIFLMTMNTVDRSTEEVDDALIGRLAAVEVPPRVEDLLSMLEANNVSQAIRTSLARLYSSILTKYPLGHGYFSALKENLSNDDILKHYRFRIRPVLYNFLGELRINDLHQIDNLVDELFVVL
jgi:5-methylcytosine-specific restriction protein B